jgi:hypothetical protein
VSIDRRPTDTDIHTEPVPWFRNRLSW